MASRLANIGPGAMVAAAFIGPGTVTSATIAGTSYGYALLWAVLFATIATCFLQEMAMRLGVAGRMGLGEAIRSKLTSTAGKTFAILIVVSSIFIGNAAYEAGNITGVSLGATLIDECVGPWTWIVACITAIVSAALILTGKFKLIEKSLVIMVAVMGVVFLMAVVFSPPDIAEVFKGMFVPSAPEGSLLTIVALIGTTVVPYNLFLHASSAKQKWDNPNSIVQARWDTFFSIGFGGLITMAILVAASAAAQQSEITQLSSGDLGTQLAPLLGPWSTLFVGAGFIAAGLSSAITAPLAASFALTEIFGWKKEMKSIRFRLISMIVIAAGLICAVLSFKPQTVILFAQVANGLILPVIAVFLFWVMNDKKLLGDFKNGAIANIVGLVIIAVTIMLGTKSILDAFDIL